MTFFIFAAGSFWGCLIGFTLGLAVLRLFGIYETVQEGNAHVYTLFGKVVGTLSEAGLHFPLVELGWKMLFVRWLGARYVIDMRLDQCYLRSAPVNSEEGAPMGIGIWYEMYISDPVSYLFKNADPQGSLSANVSNAVVRCLSNMPLEQMLETRHAMSLMVRQEVSPQSHEYGYRLGSVYIRKVHFRDVGMIGQIENKVVNRLRQVTSAIRQDGANQVSVITSTAARVAAEEFAKADAVRPEILGDALGNISKNPRVLKAMFEVLEYQALAKGGGRITLIPRGKEILQQLIAATQEPAAAATPIPAVPTAKLQPGT